MGNKQYPTGVRPHYGNIQIRFKLKGEKDYTCQTISWNPTPANIERAGKLRRDIATAIKLGVFRWEDFFPDSPRAVTVKNADFTHFAQAWLDSPLHDWKPQSRYKFRGILQRVWIPALHNKPIRNITYTNLTDALSLAIEDFKKTHGKEPSKSLYNDWLLCVRGVFDTAIKDQAIKRLENPAAELQNKTRDRTEPDPFDIDEADAIIENIYQEDGPMWGAWVELGFYSGLRYPSEPSALWWPNVDMRKREFRITQIRSKHAKGGIQKTTKTGVARTVLMNVRSEHAFLALKELTGFKGEYVFMQDNGPVITGDPQRAIFRACLKRLGIRERDPYNMRHTYATFGLMNNANPAFMANQLGHSIEEFFKTYAKWIGRVQDQAQVALIENAIEKSGRKVAKKNTKKDNLLILK